MFSEHIISFILPFNRNRLLTLSSVYTSTLTSDNGVKVFFCNLLDRTIQIVSANDKFIILRDFSEKNGE